MPRQIRTFSGEYGFLSNFWKCDVEYDGQLYPSLEHAFQAAKTEDKFIRETIRAIAASADAKRLGRTIDLIEDWDAIKFDVMKELIRDKFTRHADLKALLLATGDAELVEGNYWHDIVWGQCDCATHHHIGLNFLGKILMEIREELANGNV